MARRRIARAAALGALAALLPGCGLYGSDTGQKKEEGGTQNEGTGPAVVISEEAKREGLEVDLGGIAYNVFITRQLNPRIAPDNDYYRGPEPPPGFVLYGVFLQVCNHSDGPREAARDFKIVDTRGSEFEPEELPPENVFAYRPKVLQPKECIPAEGSAAALSSTAGAMVLFRLPSATAENRPLELEVMGPYDFARAERPSIKIELDI